MEFRLLGPVEVAGPEGRVAVNGAKPRALLAALLLERGRVVPAERLIHLLWEDDPPESASSLIHTYVSGLRKALPGVIDRRPPGYLATVRAGDLDLDVFEGLVSRGRAALDSGDPATAVPLLRQAAALWRGPALGGLRGPVFTGAAAGLEELRQAAVEFRIAAELALGRQDQLVPELTGLVREYPTNERLRGQFMVALYRLGRQAEAIACYHDGRSALVEELGVEPGTELVELYQAILRNAPHLRGPAGPEAAPAGTTGDRLVPAQLPLPPADFTGRDREIAALLEMSAPIRVITGRGGSGKSALAATVAHELAAAHPDGQLYAELAGLGDSPAEPAEVLGRFLRALDRDTTVIPDGEQERAERFRSLVAGRRYLIVLDDVRTARQVRPLLPGTPNCTVLITSRDRLAGLAGVGQIELDVLDEAGALDLLGRIAGEGRVADEPEAARDIVRHCGRLPLAVRIAGARLLNRRSAPVSMLARRLSDERQRLAELAVGDLEVAASIGLSYRILDPQARLAIGRLGYTGVGVFSPWVLAWLLATDVDDAETVVERLVDAQLVDFIGVDPIGRPAYRLHDLVRIYARERADQEETAGDLADAVRRALGGWLSLVDAIAAERLPEETGSRAELRYTYPVPTCLVEQAMVNPREWFEADQSALITAVERAATIGLHEIARQFSSTRSIAYFLATNRFEARSRIIAAAMAAVRHAGDRHGEAVLLSELGQLHYDQDRYGEARLAYVEALTAFRETGDRGGEAATLGAIGGACREQGYLTEAVHFLEQAAVHFDTLGDRSGAANALRLSGSIRLELGDYPRARVELDQALALYRQIGGRRGEALTLRTLSLYHRARGELHEALDLARQAADELTRMGDMLFAAYARRAMAKAQLRLGQWEPAEKLLEEALATCRSAADRWGQAITLRVIGELQLARGEHAAARGTLSAAIASWDELGLPLMRARTERDLATVLECLGDQAAAREVRARARTVFHEHGSREYAELGLAADGLQPELGIA